MFYFIGDGSLGWPGVPMRDLSVDEWGVLPTGVQQALQAAKLFSKRKPAGRVADGELVELAKTDDLSAAGSTDTAPEAAEPVAAKGAQP